MAPGEIFQIKLPQFEGPFDLLLFFIERDELDIYNIPIRKITADYLDYIHHLESLNMEQASEFILFASTLIRIKARMLLPRKELDASGREIDPRAELVDKLLEYKRYKAAAAEMARLEADRLLYEQRGNAREELVRLAEASAEGTELYSVTLFKLMNAFERSMKRLQERLHKPQHVVVKYNYSLEGQRSYLYRLLKEEKKCSFEDIFLNCEGRIHAIFNFLAMLELIQQKYLTILTGEDRNNFIVEWNRERPEDTGASPDAGA
ncbi:MAG TPA: segregation/condensation protein A [Edaphocola sp.]|nr:segregation/condensation protein A [Edaphocola sp.]